MKQRSMIEITHRIEYYQHSHYSTHATQNQTISAQQQTASFGINIPCTVFSNMYIAEILYNLKTAGLDTLLTSLYTEVCNITEGNIF